MDKAIPGTLTRLFTVLAFLVPLAVAMGMLAAEFLEIPVRLAVRIVAKIWIIPWAGACGLRVQHNERKARQCGNEICHQCFLSKFINDAYIHTGLANRAPCKIPPNSGTHLHKSGME
jgi:hypothetical protein